MPDDKQKKWGTIFMDAGREATLSRLDAMQAASRQEQWNQRTQEDYLEKVRAKATERAREILGEAYTERQKVLDEAREDARRIRLETQVEYAKAEEALAAAGKVREEADAQLDEAAAIRNAAQEDGFNAGLHQAQQELEEFRAAMGSSVAGVLSAIEKQCMVIFEGWRHELALLMKVCAEKGTGLVLDEHYQLILEQMVLQAVRQLDDRRAVTLRVHPDDEAAVADMFAAAREKLPNLGQWIVSPDPSLELGGLIAESQSGTVDSRLELFRDLVQNILEHLVLPTSDLDTAAESAVAEAVRYEAAQIAAIAPPLPEAALPEGDFSQGLSPEDNLLAEHTAQEEVPSLLDLPPDMTLPPTQEESADTTEPMLAPPLQADAQTSNVADMTGMASMPATGRPAGNTEDAITQALHIAEEQLTLEPASQLPPDLPMDFPADDSLGISPEDNMSEVSWSEVAHEGEEDIPLSPVTPPLPPRPEATAQSGHEPSREELEEELLPLPPDMDDRAQQTFPEPSLPEPSPLDAVLAGGGFLEPAPTAPKDKS